MSGGNHEYRVVFAGKPSELTSKVNTLMSNNWTPVGGVATAALKDSNGAKTVMFTQAVMRYIPPTATVKADDMAKTPVLPEGSHTTLAPSKRRYIDTAIIWAIDNKQRILLGLGALLFLIIGIALG